MWHMSAGARILVVEDDYDARTSIAASLREFGYEVLEAGDARAARRLARDGLPHLVLLDLILPDAAGFELLHQLRALPGCDGLPIVAVSGFQERADDAVACGAPFSAYLRKPFGEAALLDLVASQLAASKTRPPRA
jgi:DNA-binding response OmpR family regulator